MADFAALNGAASTGTDCDLAGKSDCDYTVTLTYDSTGVTVTAGAVIEVEIKKYKMLGTT